MPVQGQTAVALAFQAQLARTFATSAQACSQRLQLALGAAFSVCLPVSVGGMLLADGLSTLVYGDRFTGTEAHRRHVEYLANGLRALGLEVQRDTGAITRWLATRWAAKLTSPAGATVDIPATSYYPYSGATGPEGVTGALVQIPNDLTPEHQIVARGDLRGDGIIGRFVRHGNAVGANAAGSRSPS